MREYIVEEWFTAWFDSKWNNFYEIFEDNIYYSESWGPEYNGISEIKEWFINWHRDTKLITWEIKQFFHSNNYTIVEWYFHCKDSNKEYSFHGCSVIQWGKNGKINELKEYCSSLPKYNPLKK